MLLAILILFFTVVAAGWLVRFFPPDNTKWLKIALAFSGAYLFTITIIHLLPDTIRASPDPHRIGYYVLAGFFLQMVLEIFSQGIEHGHIHTHTHPEHRHGISSMPFLLLGSLFVHSFLEGSILVRGGVGNHHHHVSDNFYHVLFGIAVHHIPAGFALMSVLMSRLGNFQKAFGYLLIFAAGSPLGILFSNTLMSNEALGSEVYSVLTGLVAGNFLHISTTILFETSPDHHFNRNKLIATAVGLLLALAGELY
jgi:zinc and cadmium transporter